MDKNFYKKGYIENSSQNERLTASATTSEMYSNILLNQKDELNNWQTVKKIKKPFNKENQKWIMVSFGSTLKQPEQTL